MTDIKNIPFINKVESIDSFSLRVAIIVTSKTRVLLVRNEGKTKYKHVGGHVKLSESLYQGLKREIAEEIGDVNFEYSSNPAFFDQIWIDGDLMINAYFAVTVDENVLDNISETSKMSSKPFRFDELNIDMTFESEIRALNYYLSTKYK
ncbi:MAG: hypothetical protein ACD_61C00116G0001 [uncultured bacterium]|nr:MAG: hypothetical protein ACD_61C00116G0001 [uncultured bacterium]